MYRLELMQDSAKGANSVMFNSIESDKLKDIYNFLLENSPEFFNYNDDINDYLIEILLNYYNEDKKNLTIEEQHEKNRLTAYNDALYYALNDNDDELVDKLNNKLNDELDTITNDEKMCKYVLQQVDLYNIGINFKKVSE